jgi:type IV secretion system protein VirB10
VSTKNAAPGDKLYLESVYPVAIDGRIFLPPGTYVTGRVTEVKRPGRIKGRGELRVLFEQMILPNGTIRNFVGSLGSLDGAAEETLDRERGRVQGPGSKGEDAAAVADAARTGATIGVIAGAAGGSPGQGLGLGAAGGAAAGMAGVLLSRGPEAVLERGTQLDMILDRDLFFTEEELNFKDSVRPPAATPIRSAPPQAQGRERRQGGVLGLPF